MNLRLLNLSGRKWSNTQVAFGVFVIAFLVRLGFMLVLRPYDQPLRTEIHHLAYSIASGQGYGNPYPTPTGPTALYSPGCPLILAGIYSVFGTGKLAEAITYLIDVVAASFAFALLPILSMCLGLPRRVGLAAAIVGAVFPVYLLNEYRSTTAVIAALCLVGLAVMTAWAWKTQRELTGLLGALFGLAWGVTLLFSPNLLLIGILWLAAAVIHYRTKAIVFSVVALSVSLAILCPWAIRNEIVLGSPIFSRSNLGLELWIANNDFSAASYADNNESHQRYQPFVNPLEADQVRRLGEVAYMHQKLAASTFWIQQHPRRFATLTGDRIFRFWFPITYRVAQTVVVWGLSGAGFVGLAFAWVRQRTSFWILGSIWLAYPLVYYLVQLDNPYRYPIYWSVLLLAVYGLTCSIDALRFRLFSYLRPFRRSSVAAVPSQFL
jgi:hypothetical protein